MDDDCGAWNYGRLRKLLAAFLVCARVRVRYAYLGLVLLTKSLLKKTGNAKSM